MCYHETVRGLVTRSITDSEFSLHVGHNTNTNTPHVGQCLPDIWVDGKELYQYQTLDDEDGQGYMLTYCMLQMSDPYKYAEDGTTFTTTIIPLDSGRTLITMSEL